MHIPTDEELYILAREHSAIYAALGLHVRGDITFEQALRLALAALADQHTHLQKSYTEHLASCSSRRVI